MSANQDSFTVGALYVRQVKETSFERDAAGAYSKETELPGYLEVCVDVNGVPWVIARRKAPGLLADIARQAQAAVPTPEAPAEAPAA